MQEQRDRKQSRSELWWLGGGLAVVTSLPGRLFHWESQIRRDFSKRFSINRNHREREQGRAREAEWDKAREILLCCFAVQTWIIKSLLIFIPGFWLTLASFAWGFCLEAWLFSLHCSSDPDIVFLETHPAPAQADEAMFSFDCQLFSLFLRVTVYNPVHLDLCSRRQPWSPVQRSAQQARAIMVHRRTVLWLFFSY